MPSPIQNEAKIKKVVNAWESLRPTKSFAGMTLEQFKAVVKPSADLRKTIAELEAQLTSAQNQRETADETALAAIKLVVNAVKGDPAEGDDGDLYETMGYKRASERSSGLTRGKSAAKEAKAA